MLNKFKSNGADSDGRVPTSLRTPLAAIGGSALIAALLIVAAIGLASLASRAPGPTSGAESARPPGSGIVVRTELVDVWVPKALDKLLQDHSNNSMPVPDEIVRLAQKQNRDIDLWYAVTAHHHQVDGGETEITTIHYPLHSAREYSSLRKLFDSISAESASRPNSSMPAPRLHVIPDELLKLPPRDAIAELLKNHRN